MTLQFHVPMLPPSIITSNRTSKTNAGARGKWAARAELQAETHTTILAKYSPDIPRLAKASLAMTYRCTTRRPGDGCYRPKDVPNIGGDILKAVVDGVVDAGVLPDDSDEYLIAVALGIERVEELSEEGIYVEIQELVG